MLASGGVGDGLSLAGSGVLAPAPINPITPLAALSTQTSYAGVGLPAYTSTRTTHQGAWTTGEGEGEEGGGGGGGRRRRGLTMY